MNLEDMGFSSDLYIIENMLYYSYDKQLILCITRKNSYVGKYDYYLSLCTEEL
jgi:hypothetical protein